MHHQEAQAQNHHSRMLVDKVHAVALEAHNIMPMAIITAIIMTEQMLHHPDSGNHAVE